MRPLASRPVCPAVLVAFGVVLVVAASPGLAQEEPRVLSAVSVTRDDANPHRTYSAPVLAADPDDPDRLVAAVAEIRSRSCVLLRSSDAGRSWELPENQPVADGYPFCFQTETGSPQAVVAFGRGGTIYYAYAGWDTGDTNSGWPIGTGGGWRGNVSPIVARSGDFGQTWQTTVVYESRAASGGEPENHRPMSSIAVGSSAEGADTVYMGWKATYRDGRQLPLAAVSNDGGATFSAPVDLTAGYFKNDQNRRRLAEAAGLVDAPPPERILYYWPDLTLDDDGTLYAVWNARFGPGPQMDNTAALLSVSTDGGKSFSVTELSPATKTYRYPALAWSPAGGDRGTLHLAYEAETPQRILWVNDVYHERSTDGGRTWSQPARLSDDPTDALVGQYHPELAIAPGGRVDVAWWDFRSDDGTFTNDVYMASSTDNGATWSHNLAVTDRPVDRRLGVWYGNADIRQAPGMVATDRFTVLGWDDTRHGDPTTQTQDVFSAAVQFSPVDNGDDRAPVVVAIAVGMGAFGLLLLAVTRAQRRGRA